MNLGFAALFLTGVRLNGTRFCHSSSPHGLGLNGPCLSPLHFGTSFSSHFPPQMGLLWALFFSPFLFFFSLLLSRASSSSFSYLWMGLFWPSSSLLISFSFLFFSSSAGPVYTLFLHFSWCSVSGAFWASLLLHHLWLFSLTLWALDGLLLFSIICGCSAWHCWAWFGHLLLSIGCCSVFTPVGIYQNINEYLIYIL